MNTVTSTSSAASSAGTTSPASSNSLGKNDFLRLLTTQLQNQDPLNPMDNQAFIAQLAQFSSLEQLQGMSSKLDTLLTAEATTNQLSTTNLVGKTVLYRTDRVSLATGRPCEFQISLAGASATTTVVISDANGNVVRRLSLGSRASGTSAVSWDGLDASGNALPAGDYLVSVAATAADGAPVTAASRTRGTITGVTFDSGVARLLVGSTTVTMSDVVEITSPTT